MPKKTPKKVSGPSGANLLPRYTLRATQEEFDAYQAAADKQGIPLGHWIRDACNRRATKKRP